MPDSLASGQSPQTLKSPRCSLNGEVRKRISVRRLASLLELPPLGRGVAVPQDEEVDLPRRVAALLESEERPGRGGERGVDRGVGGIDDRRPDGVEVVSRIALFEDDPHRPVGGGEAQRLGEGAVRLLRLVGVLPLAENRGEAARVEDAVGAAVDHLKEVPAEVGVVERPGRVPRPGERFEHHPVEAEALLGGVAGVVVVEPHRARDPWRGRRRGRRDRGRQGEREKKEKSAAGERLPHGASQGSGAFYGAKGFPWHSPRAGQALGLRAQRGRRPDNRRPTWGGKEKRESSSTPVYGRAGQKFVTPAHGARSVLLSLCPYRESPAASRASASAAASGGEKKSPWPYSQSKLRSLAS